MSVRKHDILIFGKALLYWLLLLFYYPFKTRLKNYFAGYFKSNLKSHLNTNNSYTKSFDKIIQNDVHRSKKDYSKLGLFAEYLVMISYMARCHILLHHRFKAKCGEIDLIVKRGMQIVIVEIKANRHGLDERTISHSQIRRISNATSFFLSQNPRYCNHNIRFDLVVVKPYEMPIFLYNAWQC